MIAIIKSQDTNSKKLKQNSIRFQRKISILKLNIDIKIESLKF